MSCCDAVPSFRHFYHILSNCDIVRRFSFRMMPPHISTVLSVIVVIHWLHTVQPDYVTCLRHWPNMRNITFIINPRLICSLFISRSINVSCAAVAAGGESVQILNDRGVWSDRTVQGDRQTDRRIEKEMDTSALSPSLCVCLLPSRCLSLRQPKWIGCKRFGFHSQWQVGVRALSPSVQRSRSSVQFKWYRPPARHPKVNKLITQHPSWQALHLGIHIICRARPQTPADVHTGELSCPPRAYAHTWTHVQHRHTQNTH